MYNNIQLIDENNVLKSWKVLATLSLTGKVETYKCYGEDNARKCAINLLDYVCYEVFFNGKEIAQARTQHAAIMAAKDWMRAFYCSNYEPSRTYDGFEWTIETKLIKYKEGEVISEEEINIELHEDERYD